MLLSGNWGHIKEIDLLNKFETTTQKGYKYICKIKSSEHMKTVSVFFKFYCPLDSSSVFKVLGFIILDN